MMNFSVSQLSFVLSLLRGYENEARNAALNEQLFPLVDEAKCLEIATVLKLLPFAFVSFESSHIEAAASHLGSSLQSPIVWSELRSNITALLRTIDHELSQHYFYHYPRHRALMVKQCRDRWRLVINAFPDTLYEVYSAVDCYALEHNTASVFHSMRVAEHGLRALAKERKIKILKNKPVEWATWQDIIRELEKAHKEFGSKRAGPAKDRALQFYSGAIADLNNFKDEYRNSVMHARKRYDEHQALRAIECVHSFMVRVSEKIDSRHHRIRWGI